MSYFLFLGCGVPGDRLSTRQSSLNDGKEMRRRTRLLRAGIYEKLDDAVFLGVNEAISGGSPC
jgi:hypothetical protein